MRRTPRVLPLALAAALLAGLLPTLLATPLAAAPQEEDHEIRREIVVVGAQPTHRRMIVERLADRGYLGVQLLNLTPELKRHFGAAPDRGVLVSRIAADSPAAAAGVKVGDLVTSVDGEPVGTMSQLIGRISQRGAGDQVELGIVRDRVASTLRAELEQSQRRQVEVGQFVWRTGEEGPFVLDLGPESIERVITVDPETINESVSELMERLQAEGGLAGRLRLEDAQREQLEKRIAELERRLREMERQLHSRQHDS